MQRHRTAATGSREETERSASKSLQLSNLFTTMLESNALLREEIEQMEGQNQTPLERVSFDQKQSQSAVHDGNIAVQSGDLHSKTLPAYLLESGTFTSASALLESLEHSPQHCLLQALATRENKDGSICSNSSSESDGADRDNGYSQETGEDDSQGQYSDAESTPSIDEESRNQLRSDDLCPPPLSITSVSSTEFSEAWSGSRCENGQFASPGESMIETMWDRFSVEEYAPPMKQKEKKKQVSVRESVKQVWSHRFTIPEPFAMTVREEGKPKKKSRMLIAAEQERLEREMQEDLECQKRFRALPVPATTYVPLDELQGHKHKQQEQSEHDKVVQSIKPFSFMQREKEKRQQKGEATNSDKSRKSVFRAKPVPHSILSPHISEQLKEKEEYRKILIKARSQDMLGKASLPSSMQYKHREYAVQKHTRGRMDNKQNEAFVTKEHTFHPKIKPDIPDHDQLYSQFQQTLAVRKEVKPPTTPKPFVLRTSSMPQRQTCLHTEQPQLSSPSLLSSAGSIDAQLLRSQPMYSVQMTETAKLRQSVSERKLAEAAEREVEEEAARRGKRRQQQELRSKVIQKVQSYDHTAWLQEKQKERVQTLRQQDQERQSVYKRELEVMKQRVASRPLVFEQISCDAAKRAAEAKYTEALKKAGLSDEQIKFLNKHVTKIA